MKQLSRTDILLLRYAAGSLGRAETLVVVTWIAIDDSARRRVEAFETLGGQIIQEEPCCTVSEECLEIVLRQIDAGPRPQTPLERLLELLTKF